VRREMFVVLQIRESLGESNKSMLSETERSNPEETHTRNGISSPVSIQIVLNTLMEDTITTKIKV
jgi:hypothetical protein